MSTKNKKQSGYIIYIVILLLGVTGLIVASSFYRSRASLKVVSKVKQKSEMQLEAETGLYQALTWMRENSQSLVDPFSAENFYDEFERTAASVGDNESSSFTLHTKLKLRGTTDSAILANDASLATAAFADATNVNTGASFNAVSSFNSLATGALIRITLIDAIGKAPSKDYGDPASGNNEPDTSFNPIYRIDSYSSSEGEGVHLYATVTGANYNSFDAAIYGENLVRIDVDCDSYDSNLGAYGAGNKNANCNIVLGTGASDRFQLNSTNVVYGSFTTYNSNAIDTGSPFGGDICADFVSGCPNPGEVCTSPDCFYFKGLGNYQSWSSYCPTDQGNLIVSSDITLSAASANPSDNCWDTVTVNPGIILTLDTVDYPYFINNLVFADETTSQLLATPTTSGKPVVLYINDVNTDLQSDTMSLVTASTGIPGDLRIIYFGDVQWYIRKITAGTFNMYMTLISPNYPVRLEGNIDFYGSIFAQRVRLLQNTGHGFHYDEALGGTGPAVDMTFKMTEIAFYRE